MLSANFGSHTSAASVRTRHRPRPEDLRGRIGSPSSRCSHNQLNPSLSVCPLHYNAFRRKHHPPQLRFSALAESVIGLYEAELERGHFTKCSVEHLELTTLEWVDWYTSADFTPRVATRRYHRFLLTIDKHRQRPQTSKTHMRHIQGFVPVGARLLQVALGGDSWRQWLRRAALARVLPATLLATIAIAVYFYNIQLDSCQSSSHSLSIDARCRATA